MLSTTVPIFIVGSGRSGTRMVFKLLSGIPEVEIYHEYVCTHIQQQATLYHMGLIDNNEIKQKIKELHGSAIHYSKANCWVDCSNKLSWIIEPLFALFPTAKFVHLVRDGRKVAISYFHKLNDEMYDDESVKIMRDWLNNQEKLPMPPPEKRYWWNIPQKSQPYAEKFSKFDQFQRACYQWVESNRVIMESLKNIPQEQKLFVKLEDLVADRDVLANLLAFFEVKYEEHFFEFLQTPQNVIFPMDFQLKDFQLLQFNEIAFDMMETLGYAGTEEYRVEY